MNQAKTEIPIYDASISLFVFRGFDRRSSRNSRFRGVRRNRIRLFAATRLNFASSRIFAGFDFSPGTSGDRSGRAAANFKNLKYRFILSGDGLCCLGVISPKGHVDSQLAATNPISQECSRLMMVVKMSILIVHLIFGWSHLCKRPMRESDWGMMNRSENRLCQVSNPDKSLSLKTLGTVGLRICTLFSYS